MSHFDHSLNNPDLGKDPSQRLAAWAQKAAVASIAAVHLDQVLPPNQNMHCSITTKKSRIRERLNLSTDAD